MAQSRVTDRGFRIKNVGVLSVLCATIFSKRYRSDAFHGEEKLKNFHCMKYAHARKSVSMKNVILYSTAYRFYSRIPFMIHIKNERTNC